MSLGKLNIMEQGRQEEESSSVKHAWGGCVTQSMAGWEAPEVLGKWEDMTARMKEDR